MQNLKIALLVFGNVGQGVWKIIQENSGEILTNSGFNIEISKILVNDIAKERAVKAPK